MAGYSIETETAVIFWFSSVTSIINMKLDMLKGNARSMFDPVQLRVAQITKIFRKFYRSWRFLPYSQLPQYYLVMSARGHCRHSNSLRVAWLGDRTPMVIWDFIVSVSAKTGAGAYPASSARGNGFFPEGYSSAVCHSPHLALRLRMSTAISLLFLCIIMARNGETFTFKTD